MDNKITLHKWSSLHWEITDYNNKGNAVSAEARCPDRNCNCVLIKSKEPYARGEYKYKCVNCPFSITLDKSIEDKANDFLITVDGRNYKDAEIINVDGELIKVCREQKVDSDYWVDVKISKNKKDQVQLMILAGSRKAQDKAQLFIDPPNERLGFDQNNDHPREVFTKVIAIFKNSKSEISVN